MEVTSTRPARPITDPATGASTTYDEAVQARYERLCLLTLDLAQEAGEAAQDWSQMPVGARASKGHDRPGRFDRAVATMTRAIWAHKILDRLRLRQDKERQRTERATGRAMERARTRGDAQGPYQPLNDRTRYASEQVSEHATKEAVDRMADISIGDERDSEPDFDSNSADGHVPLPPEVADILFPQATTSPEAAHNVDTHNVDAQSVDTRSVDATGTDALTNSLTNSLTDALYTAAHGPAIDCARKDRAGLSAANPGCDGELLDGFEVLCATLRQTLDETRDCTLDETCDCTGIKATGDKNPPSDKNPP